MAHPLMLHNVPFGPKRRLTRVTLIRQYSQVMSVLVSQGRVVIAEPLITDITLSRQDLHVNSLHMTNQQTFCGESPVTYLTN